VTPLTTASISTPESRPSLAYRLLSLWHSEFFSPKDFVKRALMLSVLFLIVHVAGLREFTTVLNGTMGSVELGRETSAFLGTLYIFVYLSFVLLVPMLLIAAGLIAAYRRWTTRGDSLGQ
jgi:hypothetical protein